MGATNIRTPRGNMEVSPELRAFIDRVIVPALLERFLREHAAPQNAADTPAA
jgi:hypothetical protein